MYLLYLENENRRRIRLNILDRLFLTFLSELGHLQIRTTFSKIDTDCFKTVSTQFEVFVDVLNTLSKSFLFYSKHFFGLLYKYMKKPVPGHTSDYTLNKREA